MGAVKSPGRYMARPEWYDRNPASKCDQYQNTLSPHGQTVRLTYTVPAGKKAMVELLQADVFRRTVATTAAYPSSSWNLTPSGESIKYILLSTLTPEQNAIGDKDYRELGATLALFPGDKVEGITVDGGTGGTAMYYLSYKITEFDA